MNAGPLLDVIITIQADYRLRHEDVVELQREITDAIVPISRRYPAIDFRIIEADA